MSITEADETVKEYCRKTYIDLYNEYLNAPGSKNSQSWKSAISVTFERAMEKFPNVSPRVLWNVIREEHLKTASGIDNVAIIEKAVAAEQSWKSSSGHAFEELMERLCKKAFEGTDIEIVIQREFTRLLREGKIDNAAKQLKYFEDKSHRDVFDMYALFHTEKDGKQQTLCFGCIQCKTSLRDRITRDIGPSIEAIESGYWSVVVVLDGSQLERAKKTCEFVDIMGTNNAHKKPGWHGMYVFSDNIDNAIRMGGKENRIYSTDYTLKVFKEHALKAKNDWSVPGNLIDINWRIDEDEEYLE
jgi:hypothetical protein